MSKTERKSIDSKLESALKNISKLQTKNSLATEYTADSNRDQKIADQLQKLQGMINKHKQLLKNKA